MKILQNSKEIDTFDLGIVPAGETKRFEYEIFNDSSATLRDLKFTLLNEETKIIEAPKAMMPQAVDKLIIEWSPSVTLKQGLKAELKIAGIELWG